MIGRIIVGAALLSSASAGAWAQSEAEIRAAVGEKLDAYTKCLKAVAEDVRNAGDPAAAAGRALTECFDKRHALFVALQQPPLGLSPDAANERIHDLVYQQVP